MNRKNNKKQISFSIFFHFIESLKMIDDDFRPTVSLALSILIGFTCLMIISSILCCVCRRKTASSVGGYATNPFMRIFGK
jgi:hypothetical protein